MLRAQAEGITPESLIERMQGEHLADFSEFGVGFDNYYTTHSEENRHFAELIYGRLKEAGHIRTETISQAYDPKAEMSCPDRFIKANAPIAARTINTVITVKIAARPIAPTDLKNPVSVVTGVTPIEKDSEQYFFKVSDFSDMLKEWTRARPYPERDCQQDGRMARRRPARLGYLTQRTLLGI